jgi:soluble lytic murein transglycosylase-like protein
MSAAAVGGLEPIAAGTAVGAGERVQRLQALIAQIEHRPAGEPSKTFASALDAAQSGDPSESAAYASTADYPSAPSPLGDYPSTVATPPSYASLTPTTDAGAAGRSAYAPLIEQAATRYGLNPAILSGLIQQESGFDPSARSSAGALGLTQLMPSTAASHGVAEPLDPAQSIEGGAHYLSRLMQQFGGNTADALAAYNAGPGAVQQYGGVPPYSETQQYVTKVLGYAAAYSQGGVGGSPYTETSAPASTGPVATPEVVA